MRSLRKEIFIMFILVCILSAMISGAIAVLLNADNMTQELQKTGREIVDLTEQMRAAGMEMDEIARLISAFGDYRLEKCAETVEFSDKELKRLNETGFVDTGWQADTRTYFRMDGDMYVVYAESKNIFAVRSTLEGYLNVLCTVVIIGILVYVIFERMISLISEMTEAAKRVGAGDFDVRIQSRLKRKLSPYSQINNLIDAFNRMAGDLKNIAYLRNDFVRNISHEVKTPIASISGYAQLIETTELTGEESREYAGLIRRECTYLTKLSENMLRISRMESRKQTPKSEIFSLDEQLRRAIASLYPRLQAADIALEVDLMSVKLNSDEALLSEVWLNLLDNAIKFTKGGGRITVCVRTEDACVIVRISDTGIGMTDVEMKYAFDKFYQADHSHRTEGNGLGLALSKRIVEMVGGTIDVESRKGEGSTFIVRLPMDAEKRARIGRRERLGTKNINDANKG